MISRRIIILIVAAVIVSAGVVYQLARPTEGVDIRLILVHGSDPQKVTIELKCTGTQPAYIYKMTNIPSWNLNMTFAEDIVVPPGSNIRITFPATGGAVSLEALSGEPASGGGTAIMEGNLPAAWGGKIPATEYSISEFYTRSGNQYRHTVAYQSEEYAPE